MDPQCFGMIQFAPIRKAGAVGKHMPGSDEVNSRVGNTVIVAQVLG